jgi:hypothetical protein
MVVTGTYDPYLVTLSILVAAFASYTALDLGAHVAAARGFARRVWLAAARNRLRLPLTLVGRFISVLDERGVVIFRTPL